MRQLTASQKIAILERKVAKLEEDMVINNIPLVLEKLNVKNSEIQNIFNKVSPTDVAKAYNRVKNTPELALAIAEVKRNAGGNLNSQLKYLSNVYKSYSNGNGDMKQATTIRKGSDLNMFLTGFAYGEIFIGLSCLALGLILLAVDKIFSTVFGRDIFLPIKNVANKVINYLFY